MTAARSLEEQLRSCLLRLLLAMEWPRGDVAAPDLAPAIQAELQDLTPKLEAVFDDVDSSQLLNQSRHPALLFARGEPVVITDVFSDRAVAEKTPVHRWTLKYLEENMHDGFYNVSANVNTSCCEYYEPRKQWKLIIPIVSAPPPICIETPFVALRLR